MTLDGKRIKIQIWDTAGQERFKTITTAYYRGAMGILLVYDVTNEGTFSSINHWMLAIRQHASSSVSKVLLGNKADSSGPLVAKRTVARARGQALADRARCAHRTQCMYPCARHHRLCAANAPDYPLSLYTRLVAEHSIRFFETSAKNSINIEEAFATITRDIKQRLLDGNCSRIGAGATVRLGDPVLSEGKRKGCC